MTNEIVFREPDYERLDLPSNGIGPTGLKTLLVRPMTMKEEKMLANKTLAKNGDVQIKIYESCVGKALDKDGKEIPVNLDELFLEDEFALLLFLRAISYGIDYDTEVVCESCKRSHAITINLETDLPVKRAKEGSTNIVEVTLPVSKKKVTIRYPQRKDSTNTDDIYAMLPRLINSVSGLQNTALVPTWLETEVIGRDLALLRNTVNNPPFGVVKKIKFSCENSSCDQAGVEKEVDLPITAEFFRY